MVCTSPPPHDIAHLVSFSRPVSAKDTASTGEEGEDERNESSEDKPVGVAVARAATTITNVITSNTEEYHLDYPNDKSDEHGEGGDEGHEDRPGAMIAGAAQAEEHCDSRETGSYRCK